MFRTLAALALASTSTNSSAILTSAVPWWERVTVTVTDDGKTRSCRYETSLKPQAKSCDVVDGQAATAASAGTSGGAKDKYARITFERRFNPGTRPNMEAPQPGETLLGGKTMALAIDGRGAVKDCKVVERSGALAPQYGCDEATAEQFDANAATTTTRTAAATRESYMTVLVYGHSEHVV